MGWGDHARKKITISVVPRRDGPRQDAWRHRRHTPKRQPRSCRRRRGRRHRPSRPAASASSSSSRREGRVGRASVRQMRHHRHRLLRRRHRCLVVRGSASIGSRDVSGSVRREQVRRRRRRRQQQQQSGEVRAAADGHLRSRLLARRRRGVAVVRWCKETDTRPRHRRHRRRHAAVRRHRHES